MRLFRPRRMSLGTRIAAWSARLVAVSVASYLVRRMIPGRRH